MRSKVMEAEDRLIGTTGDGQRVFISIGVYHKGPEFTTTGEPVIKMTRDHREIREYDEIAIQGLIVERGHRNAWSYGQIKGTVSVDDITDPAIPADMVRDIFDLWERCHLNGMSAGCIHQDSVVRVPPGEDYRDVYAKQTARCPEGYAYGSRWLVTVLSDEDIQKAKTLIGILEQQPKYAGR